MLLLVVVLEVRRRWCRRGHCRPLRQVVIASMVLMLLLLLVVIDIGIGIATCIGIAADAVKRTGRSAIVAAAILKMLLLLMLLLVAIAGAAASAVLFGSCLLRFMSVDAHLCARQCAPLPHQLKGEELGSHRRRNLGDHQAHGTLTDWGWHDTAHWLRAKREV